MIRINLAPDSQKPAAGVKFQMPGLNLGLIFLVLYGGAVLGIGGYWLSLTAEERRLATEIATMSSEVTRLRATTGQSEKIKAEATELRQRVQVIRDLTRNQARPVHLFDVFVDTVPQDLWITGLEEKDSRLKVKGTAFSTTAVADFMSNLRRSGKFKDVDIVIARQDLAKVPRHVTFEVTCTYGG